MKYNRSIELRYGIYYALAMLAWITLEYLAGLHDSFNNLQPYAAMIFLVIAALIFWKGMLYRKHWNGGFITRSGAFISGMFIAIFAALMSPAVNYIFHTWINPDFFTLMAAKAVESMEATEEMAKEYFNLRTYVQQSIIGILISGTIISGVIALFIGDNGEKTVN